MYKRQYTDRPIEGEVKDQLISCIEQCNEDSGIRFQLVTDEPEAFSGFMARYGKFFNVRNYIAVTGKNSADSQQACGYYGEKIVLTAQALGLSLIHILLYYQLFLKASTFIEHTFFLFFPDSQK